MAFIPVPNVVSVEFRQVLAAQQIENILYFQFGAGDPSESDMEVLLGILAGWAETELAPLLSTDLTWRELYATNLGTQTSPTATLPVSFGGAAPGPALPNNVCWCVSFRTPVRGRSGRGRNYISGLLEADVTGNTLSLSKADEIVAAYDLLRGPLITPNWSWVIVSRYTDGAPRVTGLPITVSAVTYADRFVDSQRRRLTGRGS